MDVTTADAFTVTIWHAPEGPDSPDNEAWTKTFSGGDIQELLAQIAPWAMIYSRRRKQKDEPKEEE